MRNSLSKMHYLLFALLLLALTGCGASNNQTADLTGNGQITAKLAWPDGKTSAKSVALIADVATVQLVVTGAGIPMAKGVPVAKGTNPSVEVYPGSNLIVAAYALKADGTVLYEGFAKDVTVKSGATTDVGTISLSPLLVKAADVKCVACHETTADITGQNLVVNFKQSGHYANQSFKDANGVAAGCVGCHGPSHSAANPYDGRCFECHTDKIAVHFNNYTGKGVHSAMYVATNQKCNDCHQPHNTALAQEERKAWAKSGHGDINGAAWATEDFQNPGQTACQRCHTASGFKNFAMSNFALPASTLSVAAASDKKREVLACSACHNDNNFTVRTVGSFTAPYNNNLSPKTFPNMGESNLCIACHSGRESEDTIAAIADFSNASFKNSHYKAGAALMYMAVGFRNFTSLDTPVGTSTYRKTLYPDNTTVPSFGITGGVSSTHRKLGTPLINGDSHNTAFFVAGTADGNGPCVT